MASPRIHGIRVYFNDEEVNAIRDLGDEMGISDSSAIRYLMTAGLRSILRSQNHSFGAQAGARVEDVEDLKTSERLSEAMNAPGERNRTPILRLA